VSNQAAVSERIELDLRPDELDELDRMIERSQDGWRGFHWYLVPADGKPLTTRTDAIKFLVASVEKERRMDVERAYAREHADW
jgi:hypothetical protein